MSLTSTTQTGREKRAIMIDLRSEAEILRQIDWESSLSPENKRLYRRYKANARRLFDQGRAQELLEATERLIDSHIFKIH